MSTLATSLFLLLVTPPAPITRVVVYPDRAQVTRTAQARCEGGTAVMFEAIPPSADPSSLRAHAHDRAGASLPIAGLRFEERTRKEAFAAEVAGLDGQLRSLDAERAQLADAQVRSAAATARSDRYTGAAITLMARELIEGVANVKAWGAALDLALASGLRTAAEEADRAPRLRALDRRRADLVARRQRLSLASARREYLAEVLLSCPAERNVRVELSYLVGGASWTPSYEARADEARGEVELATWATVMQATGEPWSGAQVLLSTALPRDNATPPEIVPLRIGVTEQQEKKKVLVARQEETRHAAASDDLGRAGEGGSTGGQRAAAQGLSVQLEVPELAEVPGDGSPSRLLVGKARLKARFAYRTVPRLMPFAFRVAELVNTGPWPLLPGALDAFRRGGLTGHYHRERVAQGERFQLTFGVEEGFKVKRFVVQEVVRDKGFLGTTRRFRYAYRYQVENHLTADGKADAAAELELAEQVPVSELSDVRVVIDPATSPGFEHQVEDGVVTWKVRLTRGAERQLDLSYAVDVPASYDSGNL